MCYIWMVEILHNGVLYITSQLQIQWHDVSSLKSAMVGIFTPHRNLQTFQIKAFFPWGELIVKHLHTTGKNPSKAFWLNKPWYIHSVKYHTTIKGNRAIFIYSYKSDLQSIQISEKASWRKVCIICF